MKPEIKKAWINALRSGKYKQGIGTLRNRNNEFCCLGVLSDLAVNAGAVSWDDLNTEYGLSESVRKWAGLPDNVGGDCSFEIDGDNCNLIHQNDDAGASFTQIAALIEKGL